MIMLHLAYYAEQFVFWAETPYLQTQLQAQGHYPWQARLEILHQSLRQLQLSQRPEELHTLQLQLWVPSAAEQPSAALAELSDAAEWALKPWLLNAIKLPPGKVISWLRDWGHLQNPLTATTHAAEIAIWHQLLRLAASLVWRQQILPDLEEQDSEHWQARWHPLLSPQDHLQLSELARQLPGVTQALADQSEHPPGERAYALIQEVLYSFCDTLMRLNPVGTEAHLKRRRHLNAREAWLQALRRRNGQLQGESYELQQLQLMIRRWQQELRFLADAPFQLVFQLEEPGEIIDTWYLRFFLQLREDPSLYLPLETLWLPSDQQPDMLQHQHPQAQTFARQALAQAQQICQLIWASPQASGLELSLAEVELFLQQVQELEQAGFGLRLPAWWLKGAAALKGRARFSSKGFAGSGKLSLNALIQADWQLMLGDESISLEELKALAALKAPLVQWRGRWIAVDQANLEKALNFWQSQREPSVQEILQLGPQGEGAPFSLESVEIQGQLGEFIAQLRGQRELEPIQRPQGFRGELRPYQERGLNWLAFLCSHQLGACLADDMGLGKTIQTLALIQHFRESGDQRPCLLICPSSLLSNWWHEARRFVPELKVGIHHGIERLKAEDFVAWAGQQALTITSYALIQRDYEQLRQVPWAGIILDEAQNIKNPQTKQSRAVRSLPADWRLVLTGTPVENHVGDLWTLMDFLNPGLLGNQNQFKLRYLTPIQRLQDPLAVSRLQQATAPFILRRLKSDPSIVPDLPEKQEMKVYCNLSAEQTSLYAAVVQEIEASLVKSEGLQRRGLILASLSRLKQICNHPLHFLKEDGRLQGRSGKLDRLQEMLVEILELEEKALVFTQFAEMGKLLQQHLQQHFQKEVLFLHGGTVVQQRGQMVERFQQEAGCPIFVLSLKAGGTGLNLTAANHVFHFDRWWNPAVENQATDRAYRIGQTRRVQVHKLICSGTLEEKIDAMLDEKQSMADQVVGAGENWITELNDAELQNLFRLSPEEVSS